jgi:hypothetical protein
VVEIEVSMARITSRNDGRRFSRLAQTIDEMSARHGLSISMKGTLKKFPGSIHWHLKKGRECGTLEVTLLPAERRLWFSMHDNRSAEWVMEMAREFKRQIEGE